MGDQCDSDDSADDEPSLAPEHTLLEALNAFRILEEFVYQSLPALSSNITDLKLEFDNAVVECATRKIIQTKITTFFA